MSNFNPSKDVLEKWTSTRKAKKTLGNNFSHPRIFSTVGYANDKLMFAIAFTIELITLFIAIFLSGFNPFLIIGASALFGLDLWFAKLLHKNQNNINKFNCELELAIYESKMNLKDSKTASDTQKLAIRAADKYESKKLLLKLALFVFAAAKAFFAFLVLSPYGMAVAIGVPAFFFIAAYIHINNTGFFFSESKRRSLFSNEESIFIAENGEGRTSDYGTYDAVDVRIVDIDKLPEIKSELENLYKNLSNDEKNERRVNLQNLKDISSKKIILFGLRDTHKIVYDETSAIYYLRRWGNIQDDHFFQLIDNSPMTPQLKSFIGYEGLKTQYFASNIEKAKVPSKRIKNNN